MKKGNEICLYHFNNIYMIKRKLVLALTEAWVRRVIKFFSFGTEQEPKNMSTKRKICLSAAKKMKKNADIGKTDPTLFGASRTVTMKPRLVHHSLGPGYRYAICIFIRVRLWAGSDHLDTAIFTLRPHVEIYLEDEEE